MIEAKIIGINDLARAIDALTKDLRKRVVRAALKDAARPIIQAAKANAPVLRSKAKNRTPGLLKSRITALSSKINNGRNGTLGIYIQPRATKKAKRSGLNGKNDPFYYRFVELGFHATGGKRIRGGRRTRPGQLAQAVKTGKARWIPPKQQFLGRAFASQGQNALRIFQQRIAERIAQANRGR